MLRKLKIQTLLIPLLLLAAMTWPGEAKAAQVILTWSDNSTNEDGFKIERKTTTNGTFAQIATVGANIGSYIDTDLVTGANYCYWVRAFNASGDSAYSNENCSAISGWTDYRVTLTMSSDDNDAIGVMFRYQDSDNYYRFSMDSQRSYRRLVKRENGVFTLLAGDAVPYVPGQTYQVEIVAQGTTLEVTIDGELIFSVTDPSFVEGSIAFYTWGNQDSYFSKVLVEDLLTGTVLLSEDFIGGDLSDWTIVDEGKHEGPSTWSAATGTLVQSSNIYSAPTQRKHLAKLGSYAMYNAYGTAINITDSDGDGLTDADEQNLYGTDPNEADTDSDGLNDGNEVNVTGTDPNVADTDSDGLNDGNEVNVTGTNPNIADTDSDGLNDGNEVNVTGTNPNIADTDGDGLNDGDEVNLHGTDPTLADTDGDGLSDSVEIGQGSDPLDFASISAPQVARVWTDYRVTLAMRSTDDDAIGVMFRYLDNNNYYRFSWDSNRYYRRLVKRENGVFTLLAEDAKPYVPGQTYQVEIVAQGTTLEVSIDGVLIFSVTDTSFAEGTIAFYSWGNQNSYFDDILVEDLSTGTVLLSGNFNGGDFSDWTIVDEGKHEGPSTWSAATGTLVQSSNIYSGPANRASLAKFGTFAFYNDYGSPVNITDSDGDGLTDADEQNLYGTDPVLADTDGDGLNDGDEVNLHGTDPTLADTDGDGLSDSVEIGQGSDPLDFASISAPQVARVWTDYRVTLAMRSTDDDAIGVMFRYLGYDNYYRFSWDSNRYYRRLVKRENDVFTLLAEDSVPYVPGQTYQVEIVAQGTTLEVSIDGVLIFSVTDTSFADGTIAFYSWGNEDSYFDDILVEDLSTGTVLLSDDFNGGDLSDWTIVDEGEYEGPSTWSAATGTLVQSSNIHSRPYDAAELDKLGTFILY